MTAKETKLPKKAAPITADPAWASVMSARKEDRPQARDYIEKLFHGVFEVRGDQCMGDDEAIVTAVAWFETYPVTVITSYSIHYTKLYERTWRTRSEPDWRADARDDGCRRV